MIGYQIFSSPVGEVLVAGTPFAVTHVMRGEDRSRLAADFLLAHDRVSALANTEYLKEACARIADYLSGKTQRIDVAIQLGGTEFQRKVWHALRQIPYGETTNYSQVAESIGAPDAFRAVANACGDNPVPLIIPCHRVVHKSGEVSGFAWGVEIKRFLLDMEKAVVSAYAQPQVA